MEHDAQSSRRYKENWDDAVQASKADAAEIAELKGAYALLFKAQASALLKADLWDAINILWNFQGKTLEEVMRMRATELSVDAQQCGPAPTRLDVQH